MKLLISLIVTLNLASIAQETILWNGEVHTGAGNVLPNTTLILEKGKIKKILTEKYDTLGKKVIDVTGKKVYPGLISPNATVGLTELESVRGQNDLQEVGEINPNVRTIIAYNTDSDIIPTLRQNGVLMAEIAPRGEIITGQSSVVSLNGNNWEEAAYNTDIDIHLSWPQKSIGAAWWDDTPSKANDRYAKQIESLDKFFSDAGVYAKLKHPEKVNLKLEATKGLFDSTKALFVHANLSSQITEAVLFFRKHKIKRIVIVGAIDCEAALDLLIAHKIPVIFTRVHSLPPNTHSDVHHAYKMPTKLQKANVLFCLSYEGDMEAMGSRNLAFTAGTAAAYGLSKEQALSAITINTAKILGIDKTCGSIEVGKDATLFVSEGDALDILGNKITWAAIKGEVQNLRTKQDDLYDTYKNR